MLGMLSAVGDRNDRPRTDRPRARLAVAIAVLAGGIALLAASPAAAGDVTPLVRVKDAKLDAREGKAVVTAQVIWNRQGINRYDMTVGDLRLLAVDAQTQVPRTLAESSSTKLASDPVQSVRFELSSRADLDAIRRGNRVVLTASQHASSPDRGLKTPRTYVTVAQLQKGPKRRVGKRNCADQPIVAHADLTECDLVGASLGRAQVGRAGARTELLKADLTGADMRDADLSDVDLAGGRVNGANATNAEIVGVSLAKADGVGFVAHDTTFDSSDVFDARLLDARLAGSTFKGTSLKRSRFDGSNMAGARILGADMDTTRLVDVNLRRATLTGDTLYFADLTDARLLDADMDASPSTLMWTILCRTELPDGSVENRDCTGKRSHHRPRASQPFVTVDAQLHRGGEVATIDGTVRWNKDGIDDFGMRVGEIRAVAVNGDDGTPTVLGEKSNPISRDDPKQPIEFAITDPHKLRALRDGNRVVVTATQHPPHPEPPAAGDELTKRSYATVDQLQAGPGRGRVGSADCSDQPIAPSTGPGALRFCDLVGSALADADLGSLDMRMNDLTAADLRGANLSGTTFDGSRLAGARANGARMDSASLLAIRAPRLVIRATLISSATFFASALQGARFDDSTISKTSFATAGLGGGSSFAGTQLDHVDLAYAGLHSGDLTKANATKTSLFLADLTDADLRGSVWGNDEEGRYPPRSALLCHTRLPSGDTSDRDCGR
jgi:uncharacterized protein YjbI with pentapeptide repeats